MAPPKRPMAKKPRQTRLTTPAKSSATKPIAFGSAGGSRGNKLQPRRRPPQKKNGSILDYFKKSADEDLFMGEGVSGDLVAGEGEEGQEEGEVEDIWGSGEDEGNEEEDDGDDDDGEEEARYNENGGSVKKRKVEEADGSPARVVPSAAKSSPVRFLPDSGDQTSIKKVTAPKVNPFLDDSSDEGEDEGGGTPTKHSTTVRSSCSDLRRGKQPLLTAAAPLSRNRLLLRHETSGSGRCEEVPEGLEDNPPDEVMDEYEGLGNEDMELLGEGQWGEEFREMKYMREQAMLEAEEAGIVEDSGLMEECCPICNGSLAGVTEDQATAHVNACLDGKPTPLPEPPDSVGSKVREDFTGEVGKRFAKAAVPRPGQANPFALGDDDSQPKSAFARLMNGHAEDSAWASAAAAENASRGMPAYKRTCPFYKIMPGFSICVDAFRYGAVEGCNAYFLSHFHSDHYVGLTANWTHGPIYCSKVTGSLVKSQLRTAAKFVVELEFDKKVAVPDAEGVSVTMIPANHCPGSSLFLFEKAVAGKKTHRILHCGDFRACPAHVSHPELRPETVHAISGKTCQQKIDVCYLDTTYLNPRYSFPPQDDVVRACAEICVQLDRGLAEGDDTTWNALLRRREGGAPPGLDSVAKFFKKSDKASLSSRPEPDKPPVLSSDDAPPPPPDTPNNNNNAFTALLQKKNASPKRSNRLLVVCGTYSIGKERICKAIALALRTKIYASPQKIRICRQLDDPELDELMTSDPREAQVHMQMLMEIRADTLAEYLEQYSRDFGRIVGFRPSGWNFRSSSGTGGGGGGAGGATPTGLSLTQLLHGSGWRTRFDVGKLVPQRGSSREAMCFGVPYSEHSSFRELAMFLMALRIERVVPTVNVGSEVGRRRMRGWTDRWLAERRRGGLVRVLEGDTKEREEDVVLWDGKGGKGGHVYW